MRILSNEELLRREATWLRNGASQIRWYVQAFPDLGDRERRPVQMAVLHAWIRNRYPLNLQFVTNYVATVVTAVGMAAASAAAGVIAALFATGTGGSARAPWWLFPTATWAAVCLSALLVTRDDIREIVSPPSARPSRNDPARQASANCLLVCTRSGNCHGCRRCCGFLAGHRNSASRSARPAVDHCSGGSVRREPGRTGGPLDQRG